MSTWTTDDLDRFAAADDLHVSPFRADGSTYGTPTWVWSVVVDGDLYARAWNGRRSSWWRAAVEQGAGGIRIAGAEHDVRFDEPGPDLNSRIDAAYEEKYAGSPYLQPMLQDGPTAATIRIRPRSA